MTKRSRSQSAPTPTAPEGAAEAPPGDDARPSPGSLAGLTALGVVSALWALFLWLQLVLSRAGGTPFCALGDQADCAAVWNSSFASAIHAATGLPIAGWGLLWGLVALALPLVLLARHAQGHAAPELVSAVRLTAAAGTLTVFVMIAVSLSERAFCSGCFVTYVLVAGYAGIALSSWRRFGLPEAGRGAAWAGALTLAGFVALLYPGTHTPRGGDQEGRAAVAAALAAGASTPAPAEADSGETTAEAAERTARANAARERATGDDAKLFDFIAGLPAAQQQGLSNALARYSEAPPGTVPAARAVVGKLDAPVRVTEFTDTLCSHCADLHETLTSLRGQLPPGSFSIEPRQYPLDASCNRSVRAQGLPVRCLAARAHICMEGKPEALVYSGLLYQRQRQLTPDVVFDLASPYVPRDKLERCIADPATQAKLEADIALADSYGITGTPLVLINGRQGAAHAPFLYAMVLTRGAAEHPAFDLLPPPNADAHAGHAH